MRSLRIRKYAQRDYKKKKHTHTQPGIYQHYRIITFNTPVRIHTHTH